MTDPRASAPALLNRRLSAALAAGLTAAVLIGIAGCAKERPQARTVTPVVKDVPAILRGTVGSEVEFRGIEPVLVSGYGLVVGLNGTGGDVLPDAIAATMEREMGLNGITKANEAGNDALANRSPREVLRDKNVAVVLVQAAIPPGAPANADFDVYVQALNATSLEGGRLYSTDLRLGEANTFGSVQARRLAVARGPVFINPFDTAKGESGANRVTGRILAGGQVTNPMGIELVLNNPSFARTRAIVSAINSRFPSGPGDPVATARGRSGPDMKSGTGGSIELHVPNRFRKNPADFIRLVTHLPIEQGFSEQYARRYVEGMKAEPVLAEDLSWCLEAVGNKSLPFLRELYDFPERAVQMAALRAGSRLGDPLAAPHLKEVALRAQGNIKTRAIAMLGEIDNSGPSVDEALRDLLAEDELSVRVAAYEALAGRAERNQLARLEAMRRNNPDTVQALSPTALQIMASSSLSGRTIQGVERTYIEGKFFLDIVPVGEPMIYVTQQGQPRIVLFGEDAQVRRPVVVSVWEDRLLLAGDPGSDTLRVRYTPANGARPMTQTVKPDLPKLIEFLARKMTPEDPRPGLNLTYSEVVGVLSTIQQSGGTRAAFAKEVDYLSAKLNSARTASDITHRPETPEDRELIVVQPKGTEVVTAPDPTKEPPKIVPITPSSEEERKAAQDRESKRVRGAS